MGRAVHIVVTAATIVVAALFVWIPTMTREDAARAPARDSDDVAPDFRQPAEAPEQSVPSVVSQATTGAVTTDRVVPILVNVQDAQSGAPVSGGRIEIVGMGSELLDHARLSGHTIELIGKSPCWIAVFADKYLPVRFKWEGPGGSRAPLIVELKHGLSIRGRVIDGVGRPVGTVGVRIADQVWPTESPALRAWEWTDAESGAFELAGLEPGEYGLDVKPVSPSRGRLPDEIRAQAGDEDVVIRLSRVSVCRVYARDSESGASISSRVAVCEESPEGYRVLCSGRTKSGAGIPVYAEPQTSRLVTIRAEGYRASKPVRLGFPRGGETQVVVAMDRDAASLGLVKLRLIDSDDQPVSRVRVRRTLPGATRHYSTWTSETDEGMLRLELPVGKQEIQISPVDPEGSPSSMIPATIQVDVPGAAETSRTIRFDSGGWIRYRFANRSIGPLTLCRGPSSVPVRWRGLGDGWGRNREPLPPGEYHLTTRFPGGIVGSAPVTVRAGESSAVVLDARLGEPARGQPDER